jgi:hypothetical protein
MAQPPASEVGIALQWLKLREVRILHGSPELAGIDQYAMQKIWNFLQFWLAKAQINVMLALTIRAGTRSLGLRARLRTIAA